jgi:toxin-antitoxin system PIN domain toxin
MKPCLADVNVVLALLVRRHEHHKQALRWFNNLSADEAGICRFVQLGIIRLLSNRNLMNDEVLSPSAAWQLVDELLEDERVIFLHEPPDLGGLLPSFLNADSPATKLVGDAYLAAFSIAGARRMVTLDRGFRQFKGLNLDLLLR